MVGYLVRRAPASAPSEKPVATVRYSCNGGKAIIASFYQGTTTPAANPGEPPQPGGSAMITLSDGRSYTLKQTVSADGMRYSNGNPTVPGGESFVFWGKGNGALVLENNAEKSYLGCIAVAPQPSGASLPQIYSNGSEGFSIRLSQGYAPSSYTYEELGPGKGIGGIKFTIPASVATSTNLADDTYVSVEEIPQATTTPASVCNAARFLSRVASSSNETDRWATADGGSREQEYHVGAGELGAAAGNRYEETVYAIPDANPCVAVRYFIHYGVIENYPPGAVREFDKAALLSQFDAIRRTLVLAP